MPINLELLNKLWKTVQQTIDYYTAIKMKELELCQMICEIFLK